MYAFIVVPLSEIDQNGVHNLGITFGYVVKRVDVPALQKAAEHTANRWRLLAGRIEWNVAKKTYQICVPVSKPLPKDYALIEFTTSRFPASRINLPSLNEDSRQVLERPPLKYFRGSATPSSLSEYAAKSFPLMAIHVSVMQNCTCVGISFPHGAFDATGMGMAVQGINAALNNIEWVPPMLHPSGINILENTLSNLREADSMGSDLAYELPNLTRAIVPSTIFNLLRFWFSIAFEMFWHNSTTRAVYLGRRTVEHIMVRMMKESEESGKSLVSKGDMLVAWLLKAAYLEEGCNTPTRISINSVFSMRRILAEINPEFEQYPHNAFTPISLPFIDFRSISSMSLYDLALRHRESLNETRNVAYIRRVEKWRRCIGGGIVPLRRRGLESWLFSNQVISGLETLNLGSEQVGPWFWGTPALPDHNVTINKFREGGYLIKACVRASQWRSIEKALERMEGGADPFP
ncbi:hypothetical protein BDP27DRAFT_1433959 [Rhodocollybia butyracea]|uniref:Uncharacterized protein n=1 Tax=Rhodocollybia butyracea TaxID=206335 RepID=A0A9P5TVY3_9AGAR|nr:hypothetical protein BDP27DRAFT_1433959 [Rhodocollybia butyracea]